MERERGGGGEGGGGGGGGVRGGEENGSGGAGRRVGVGRRKGKLSNIHLGALDPVGGGYVMLGKTFKGMTDAMLEWQTVRFQELAAGGTEGYVVQLRPEQVVEVAFDGVQGSSRYPGGLALRFARVLRYRDDKRPEEADTIDTVRAMYRG